MTMSLPPIMNAIAFEFEADEPAGEAEDIERIEDVEDAEDVELIEDTEDAGDVVSGQDNG